MEDNTEIDFNSLSALARSKKLWLRLADSFVAWADATVEDMEGPQDGQTAIQFARQAEACFWQATGDQDAIDLKDVLTAKADQSPQGENGEAG